MSESTKPSDSPERDAATSESAPDGILDVLRKIPPSVYAGTALVLGTTIFAYWTTLASMVSKWESDPQYSHGWLVPAFSIVLLWMRRDKLDPSKLGPNWIAGVSLITLGLVGRWVGVTFFFEWFDQLSLIPVLAGAVLLIGGWHAIAWAWPALGFLFFMVPLPYTLEAAMRAPLRSVGTTASTYIMQTIGLPAFAEGYVVVVDEHRIGVVEACSGLRMLMIFFALSSAVALLMDRPLWERGIVLLSAIPIALIANITRIAVTGIIHVTCADKLVFGMKGEEFADYVFHDIAGLLMMPLGLLLLWAELWFLSHLFIIEEDNPMSVGLRPTDGDSGSADASIAGATT